MTFIMGGSKKLNRIIQRIDKNKIKERLEYLRGELRKCEMSYGELAELQSLAKYIESSDVELLEAAGVPEFEEEKYKVWVMMKEFATEEEAVEYIDLNYPDMDYPTKIEAVK